MTVQKPTPSFLKKNKFYQATPDWSPNGKLIVYSSNNDTTGSDIYITDASGTDPRQLTKNSGSNTSPRFDPTGKHILFISNRTGKRELWHMDIHGNEEHALGLQGLIVNDPAFSPDGASIVYSGCKQMSSGSSLKDRECYLYITAIGAKITKKITMGTANRLTLGHQPDWGDAGIVFAKTEAGCLWMINPDGTNLRSITKSDNGFCQHPRWVKANGNVLFSKTKDDTNIWSLDTNGSENRLTNFFSYQ